MAMEEQIKDFLISNEGTAGGKHEGGRTMGSRVGDKVKSERGYNVHTAGQYAKKKKSGVKTENNRSAKTPVP